MRKQDERTSVLIFFFNFQYFQECDVLLAKNMIVMIHKNNIRYWYSKLRKKKIIFKKNIRKSDFYHSLTKINTVVGKK